MKPKILIIDDEVALCKLLSMILERRGFEVQYAHDGVSGIRMAFDFRPDLIILDVIMPRLDGYQTSQQIRELSDVPILIISAQAEEHDIVLGFHSGADDFVRKPFGTEELVVRIQSLIQRSRKKFIPPASSYSDPALTIDVDQAIVIKHGQPIDLSPTEQRLLAILLQRLGQVVPTNILVKEVWGNTIANYKPSLALYIRYLRKKLEDDPSQPKYIRTAWGVGYWFAPQEDAFPNN